MPLSPQIKKMIGEKISLNQFTLTMTDAVRTALDTAKQMRVASWKSIDEKSFLYDFKRRTQATNNRLYDITIIDCQGEKHSVSFNFDPSLNSYTLVEPDKFVEITTEEASDATSVIFAAGEDTLIKSVCEDYSSIEEIEAVFNPIKTKHHVPEIFIHYLVRAQANQNFCLNRWWETLFSRITTEIAGYLNTESTDTQSYEFIKNLSKRISTQRPYQVEINLLKNTMVIDHAGLKVTVDGTKTMDDKDLDQVEEQVHLDLTVDESTTEQHTFLLYFWNDFFIGKIKDKILTANNAPIDINDVRAALISEVLKAGHKRLNKKIVVYCFYLLEINRQNKLSEVLHTILTTTSTSQSEIPVSQKFAKLWEETIKEMVTADNNSMKDEERFYMLDNEELDEAINGFELIPPSTPISAFIDDTNQFESELTNNNVSTTTTAPSPDQSTLTSRVVSSVTTLTMHLSSLFSAPTVEPGAHNAASTPMTEDESEEDLRHREDIRQEAARLVAAIEAESAIKIDESRPPQNVY